MQREYTYARGSRIFLFSFVALLAVIPMYTIYSMIVNGLPEPMVLTIIMVVGAIVLPVVLAIVFTNEGLSVIYTDNDGIRYKSFLYTRELLWSEVVGYRKDGNVVILVPGQKSKRKIQVSAYRSNYAELVRWADNRYRDLDRRHWDLDSHYRDRSSVKGTRVLDQGRLREAKHTAWTLNITATVLAALSFFLRHTVPWLPVLLIILLPVALMMVRRHRGFLIINTAKKEEILPDITWTTLCCTVGLFLFTMPVYTVGQVNLWIYTLIVEAALVGLTIFSIRDWEAKRSTKIVGVITYAFLLLIASYGMVVFINVFLDTRSAGLYQTTVVNKRISTGKSTSYYLEVWPWGPVRSSESISVVKSDYEETEINDLVNMELHRGALGLPWYRVTGIK
ncbi:hypothetical protein HHL17_15325 [Chitinophaga sp. G-6-1-13]|uniref:PH domain-containing protein n=1 Tax=Chitinophaga fulva TaxID=2728842 RepID=A0A848GRX6_9BACT|nr:hypothetical protein [Chitinophaga fulva]NML38578.1 hypothetical protein [Chitinophaga fulva]